MVSSAASNKPPKVLFSVRYRVTRASGPNKVRSEKGGVVPSHGSLGLNRKCLCDEHAHVS